MNFTQMHERLRLELLRRIQRGTLSVSLLARQSGFGQSHVSNFLHHRRQLSLEAIDRILAAQHLDAADLLPGNQRAARIPLEEDIAALPVVSHASALFEPYIRPAAVRSMLQLPSGALESVRARAPAARRAWQRFVSVRISAADALPMDPLILLEALVVIDRHYVSPTPYRLDRPTLFAVQYNARLAIRFLEFVSTRLVLRPHHIDFPVQLIDVESGESPGKFIAGRVALILNEP